MSYYSTHAFSFDRLSQKRFLKPLLKSDLFFQKSRNENKALASENTTMHPKENRGMNPKG